MSVGDWRKEQGTSKPELSMSSEKVIESIDVDETILDAVWNKAAELVHREGQIVRIPGDPFGRGRMVASTTSSISHMVTCGKKNDTIFNCDKHCPRYAAYGFCSHTVAGAEVTVCLEKFIQQITKRKRKANLLSLVYHGLPDGAGEKGGKPKQKRRCLTPNDVTNLPILDRLTKTTLASHQSASHQSTCTSTSVQQSLPSPSSQPYYFKILTPQMKVCDNTS